MRIASRSAETAAQTGRERRSHHRQVNEQQRNADPGVQDRQQFAGRRLRGYRARTCLQSNRSDVYNL